MALPQPFQSLPSPGPTQALDVASQMRRCSFRRVSAVQLTTGRRRVLPVYDVECLYPDRVTPVPLGDLASARSICDGCHAPGIFRPDED